MSRHGQRFMRRAAWAALALMAAIGAPAAAQEGEGSGEVPAVNVAGSPIQPGSVASEIWVTTQDYLALRAGPGRSFDQLVTVPAAITIPAYGRTSDVRWLQVEYDGVRGWLAARYLVWTGDVINLRVDGVDPAPFIRRAAALGTTTRDALALPNWYDPPSRAIFIPAGTEVEMTGRLGGDTGRFFRIQVRYQDGLYWIGSYDVNFGEGDYRRLLDLAYLFPYGQLFLELEENLALTLGSFYAIRDIWARLAQGLQIACDPIPPLVEQEITVEDAAREPTFIPPVLALEQAIGGINGAITQFRDACADPSYVLTRETIALQVAALDEAYRNLILSASLIDPLRVRNPLLQGGSS